MRLSGWLAGLPCTASSSCLSCRPGLGFCAGPFLQLVAAGPGSYLSIFRGRGILEQNCHMAAAWHIGRCDRVLDSIYPPAHISPGWVGGDWASPQKKHPMARPTPAFSATIASICRCRAVPVVRYLPDVASWPVITSTSRMLKLEQLPVPQPDSV